MTSPPGALRTRGRTTVGGAFDNLIAECDLARLGPARVTVAVLAAVLATAAGVLNVDLIRSEEPRVAIADDQVFLDPRLLQA